jgi:hypothetical protein
MVPGTSDRDELWIAEAANTLADRYIRCRHGIATASCAPLGGRSRIVASTPKFSGTIRLVLYGSSARGRGRGRTARGGKLEIHHAVPEAKACVTRPCGLREIGIDKGYTEVFTDSDGQRYGLGLGAMLTTKTDANKVRCRGRQTLAALADKHLVKGRYRKHARIEQHNLGRQKIARQKACHRAEVRTKAFTATHAVVDKAAALVVEDLSRPIVGYDRGKNMNRRLSGWVTGLFQEARYRFPAGVERRWTASTQRIPRKPYAVTRPWDGVTAERFTAPSAGRSTMSTRRSGKRPRAQARSRDHPLHAVPECTRHPRGTFPLGSERRYAGRCSG